MPTMTEKAPASCWRDEFWIHHCEGFRVEQPDGTIGVIEGIARGADGDVTALFVREDDELHAVPIDHVEAIDGWYEVVVLRGSPSLHARP